MGKEKNSTDEAYENYLSWFKDKFDCDVTCDIEESINDLIFYRESYRNYLDSDDGLIPSKTKLWMSILNKLRIITFEEFESGSSIIEKERKLNIKSDAAAVYAVRAVVDKHTRGLDAIKHNRSKWKENKWTPQEIAECDRDIAYLDVLISDLNGALKGCDTRVINGSYIENPACDICAETLSHDWIDGDYTVLVCNKNECIKEMMERSLEKLKSKKKK